MSKKNILYAQSGGPTAVINASACGVIEAVKTSNQFGTVFAAKNGILGALKEELIDTFLESEKNIAALKYTPASAFGSCRYQLKSLEKNDREYHRLIEVFKAHDIGYFFYNGGGDSQDTAYKVSQMSEKLGHPMICIGIPKTIDNDLPFTDNCPGFGSVAKYIAISTKEAALDVKSMSTSSTKVFILEVMGRHAGWIAAAAGLAQPEKSEESQIILFPEIPFDQKTFLARVDQAVKTAGFCVIVASEGIRNTEGKFIQESGLSDAFGHAQLGGIAPLLAQLIKTNLGYKYHWGVADYLQRAARHIASQTDVDQAYLLGQKAVEYALQGKNKIMLTIKRESNSPYRWSIGEAPLAEVANQESKMPHDFISPDGYSITKKCRDYLLPLIQGEAYPPYRDGIPDYVILDNKLVEKKLKWGFEI